jgi:peptide/nickel transport system ATP-binding protein
MVMYTGNRMEYGRGASVFRAPAHPYTAGLLILARQLCAGLRTRADQGRPPSLLATPAGCVFAPRCAVALPHCSIEPPPLRVYSDHVESLCWREEGTAAVASAVPAAQMTKIQAGQDEAVVDVKASPHL